MAQHSTKDDLPLAEYRRSKRVLLIAAPSDSHADYQQQQAMIATHRDGLAHRKLVIKDSFENEPQAKELRRAYELPEKGFAVALISLDGSVQERQDRPMDMDFLFGLIDSTVREQEAAE